MMKPNSNRLLWLAAALLAFGCRDQPRPVENTTATAPPPAGLTPLTSRDAGAPTAATTEPAASAQLPPGHPSIDRGAAPAVGERGTISGTIDVAPSRKRGLKGGGRFVMRRNADPVQVAAS